MSEPLSQQLRPSSFEEVMGQDHLIGPKGLITQIIKKGKPLSILLWGPPGCGKTSIAHLYAKAFNCRFETISAIFSGIAELKKIFEESQKHPLFGRSTILFVDEIHRFNKAQQDAFLPYVENGTIILVGATAENPSFYLNNALLSRLRVLKLEALNESALDKILSRCEKQLGNLNLEKEAREHLLALSSGDGRYLLNLVENISTQQASAPLSLQDVQNLLQQRSALFDKAGEGHYNLISALHKSVRGSDPQASLYWLCRMLEAGEDPLFIARRLIRMASEDVGLADPDALKIALAARDSYQSLGSPEGELALAEATLYLALAPKSNALYLAYKEAKEEAAKTGHLSPPATILNAPNAFMKKMGYGKGYFYDHDSIFAFSGQNYFPDQLKRRDYYAPNERGYEREMKKRLDYFDNLRKKLSTETDLT